MANIHMKRGSTQYDDESAAGARWNGTACATGKTIPRLFFFILLLATSFSLLSCKKTEQRPSQSSSPATDTASLKKQESKLRGKSLLRIVSLSPALTDMLIDLGLRKAIVGRDAWDEQLADSIPRVGDLSNLDLERVILLKPTHLILQQGGRGVPESLKKTAEDQHWTIINLHIDSLADLLSALHQLAGDMADACQNDKRRKVIHIKERILTKRFHDATAPLDNDTISGIGTVLSFYSLDPPGAFGPGSYLSDILKKMGIPNALQSGGAWQNLDGETILRADPQTILIIKAGAAANTGQPVNPKELAQLPLRAVGNNRTVVISHPQALLPGTSLIELAEIIRGTLIRLSNSAETVDTDKAKNASQEGESH